MKKIYHCYSCGCRIRFHKVEWYNNHPYCKWCLRNLLRFKNIEDTLYVKYKNKEKSKYRFSGKYKGRGKYVP